MASRYYNTRLDIQETIDHLTAPDQSRLDHEEGVDVNKMCDALAHLRKAKALLRDAELAANQKEQS